MGTKRGWMLTYLKWFAERYTTLWSRGLARSSDKLRPLYLHNHNDYGQQISQHGNLTWWAPANKVAWPLITWSWKITWQTETILSVLTQYPWLSNLARVVRYHEELTLITLHDPPVTWFGEVMWKNKHFTFPLALDHWLPSMEKWGLKSVSSNKFTQTFKLVVMLQMKTLSLIITMYMVTKFFMVVTFAEDPWTPY